MKALEMAMAAAAGDTADQAYQMYAAADTADQGDKVNDKVGDAAGQGDKVNDKADVAVGHTGNTADQAIKAGQSHTTGKADVKAGDAVSQTGDTGRSGN